LASSHRIIWHIGSVERQKHLNFLTLNSLLIWEYSREN